MIKPRIENDFKPKWFGPEFQDRVELPYTCVQGQIGKLKLPVQKTRIVVDNLDCLGIFKAHLKPGKKQIEIVEVKDVSEQTAKK